MTIIASIAARNYLPRARVLADSVRAQHPSMAVHLLLADEANALHDPASEPFRVVALERLGIEDQRGFCFRYGLRQRAAALKPYLLRHLLDQGHEHVLFLDPDMLVTGSIAGLLDAVHEHAIVLTAHLLQPSAAAQAVHREREILRAGQFNAGVVGVRDEPQARAFLGWWRERVEHHARDSVAEGMYFDQRWLDLAPGLFERLHVVCDSGYNVAHWNLDERPLHRRDGQLFSGEQPCRLLHFSGFDPDLPDQLSTYAEAGIGASSPALPDLLREYRQRLFDAGQEKAGASPSAWEQFANGRPITPAVRAIYALQGFRYDDPFACGGGSFFTWLNAPADARTPPLSNFWYLLPMVVPDLRERWPGHLEADRQAYVTWVEREGRQSHPFTATGA